MEKGVVRVGWGAGLAAVFTAAVANAAPSTRAASRDATAPVLVQSSAATNAASAGRARMGKGDCAGALDAFDQALQTSTDPVLHRDRGRCHDKLGHPFPAIDDYRVYLFARPDAPDAEAVQERLNALEESSRGAGTKTSTVGTGSPEDAMNKNAKVSLGVAEGPAAGLSAQNSESSAPSSETSSGAGEASPSNAGKSLDQIEAEEIIDQDSKNSPLRLGRGFIIGPYFQYRSWGLSAASSIGTGYGVGGSFRESLSKVSTLLLELGYVSYGTHTGLGNAPSLNLALGDTRGGFATTLAYEARIRLDTHATNALTATGGFELNRLAYQQTNDTFTTVFARGRFGYRHIFGPAFGLEGGFDIAFPLFGAGTAANATASTEWQKPLAGIYVALVVGF